MEELPGQPLIHRRLQIGMEDTDPSGHVFFGAVQRWQSSLVSNWLAEAGHGIWAGLNGTGTTYPVVTTSADYMAPLWLDDHVLIGLYRRAIGTSSFSLTMAAFRVADGGQAIRAATTHVCVTNRHRRLASQPIPDTLRRVLAASSPPPHAVARS